MANKPLKTIQFPNLPDTYTVPQVDATLAVTGGAADAKVTGDTLAEKADKDGVIATAEGLIGGAYTIEKEPYHFRKTAVDLAGRLDETIVGGSLVWNQLVQNGDFANGTNGWNIESGVTATASNNVVTINLSTANNGIYQRMDFNSNHKYLMAFDVSADSVCTVRGVLKMSSYFSMLINANTSKQKAIKIAPFNGDTVRSDLYIYADATTTIYVSNVILIDLTAMFGTTIADYIYSLEQATAGAGVAWLKAHFPKIFDSGYIPYNAGTLEHVSGLSAHKMTGFNQFDGTVVTRSYIDNNNGEEEANPLYSSSGYIPVLPSTVYYVKSSQTNAMWGAWYDADKNYIRGVTNYANATITSPEGAYYLRLTLSSNASGDPSTFCINLSDPAKNGTYEPYKAHSYPLDSTLTLRGVPKLVTDHIEFDGDKYRADGTVERRYGIVDLGSLTWAAHDSSRSVFRGTSISNKRTPTNNAFCVGYEITTAAFADMADKTMRGTTDLPTGWFIRDTAYTDAAAFKTAMSGVMLVYELATPTTETATPFQSPMIVGATEEYISDSVVPVGHESRYYEDVAKKVSGLPKDFSTLIAPTEVSYTATRNYSVGSYLIVKNQLYKVTSAISSGGTITPNSNVTATTIMAEILALA